MRKTIEINVNFFNKIEKNIPFEMLKHEKGAVFTSNDFSSWANGFIRYIAAIGNINATIQDIDALKREHIAQNDWYVALITYDYKNNLENLKSSNPTPVKFPIMECFRPLYLIVYDNYGLRLEYDKSVTDNQAHDFINNLLSSEYKEDKLPKVNFTGSTSKYEYIETVDKIKDHIKRGDIYEMNYCINYSSADVTINPATTWHTITKVSPTPFAAFIKNGDKFLISASPERYLLHEEGKLTSQPIKGTAARNSDKQTDENNRLSLETSEKERAENIMICDLVRNDLSKVAARGTVRVTELCGIYGFRQVWQMISTVEAVLMEETHWSEALKATFPMGSMTGAPKVRAMQLIDQYEKTSRNLYSGTVGFISPSGNFDFNVVIRSLLYDAGSQTLTYSVGSAITMASDAEKEYEECQIKAGAMRQLFNK